MCSDAASSAEYIDVAEWKFEVAEDGNTQVK